MKKKNATAKNVRAVIELKITPQRNTGFGKIASKVSKYAQVDACFLMSGAYVSVLLWRNDQ